MSQKILCTNKLLSSFKNGTKSWPYVTWAGTQTISNPRSLPEKSRWTCLQVSVNWGGEGWYCSVCPVSRGTEMIWLVESSHSFSPLTLQVHRASQQASVSISDAAIAVEERHFRYFPKQCFYKVEQLKFIRKERERIPSTKLQQLVSSVLKHLLRVVQRKGGGTQDHCPSFWFKMSEY